MANRTLIWIAALAALIAFILSVVAIVMIRRTWNSPQQRESSLFWLYFSTIAIFITALMVAIAAELTPNLCQLPYSRRFVEIKEF